MVLRVKATPTRFSTNSAYTPMDNAPLDSISSVCHPWGTMVQNVLKRHADSAGSVCFVGRDKPQAKESSPPQV